MSQVQSAPSILNNAAPVDRQAAHLDNQLRFKQEMDGCSQAVREWLAQVPLLTPAETKNHLTNFAICYRRNTPKEPNNPPARTNPKKAPSERARLLALGLSRSNDIELRGFLPPAPTSVGLYGAGEEAGRQFTLTLSRSKLIALVSNNTEINAGDENANACALNDGQSSRRPQLQRRNTM